MGRQFRRDVRKVRGICSTLRRSSTESAKGETRASQFLAGDQGVSIADTLTMALHSSRYVALCLILQGDGFEMLERLA
jgi:hypothetical protein